jgi:hypothetical protein
MRGRAPTASIFPQPPSTLHPSGGLELLASIKKSRRGAAQKLSIGANIFRSVRAVQGIAEAGQGKADVADKAVKVGCYVKVTNLKNRSELNDIVGVVMQIDDGSAVIATQVVQRCLLPLACDGALSVLTSTPGR